MTPRTVPIICSRAPRHIVYVPAVRRHIFPGDFIGRETFTTEQELWTCSWCGARVKVVA